MLQCKALLRWPDYVRIRSEKQGFIILWTSLLFLPPEQNLKPGVSLLKNRTVPFSLLLLFQTL